MSNDEASRVPDLLLERLHLGELDPREAAEVRARLEREPGGIERLAALSAADAAVLAQLPPAVVRAEVLRRFESAPPSRPRWLRVAIPSAVVLAAACVLVLIALPLLKGAAPPDDGRDGIRLKGDPLLLVYLRTEAGPRLLKAGEVVDRGDLLRLGYNAGGARHGMILSLDGGGAVTLHFPAEAGGSTALTQGGAQRLPFAYELDDAPGFERFFFVTSAEPLDVERLRAAVEALGSRSDAPLRVPGAVRVRELLLKKRR